MDGLGLEPSHEDIAIHCLPTLAVLDRTTAEVRLRFDSYPKCLAACRCTNANL